MSDARSLIVVDANELRQIAAAVRSNFIHSDILARQLEEMLANPVRANLLDRAIAELRRLPCRSSPCEGCRIIAEFEQVNGPLVRQRTAP